MQEIKIRVYDKKFQKMYMPEDIGFAIYMYDGRVEFERIDESGNHSGSVILPNEDIEIILYTGLKDLTGKEIYEGDIVKSSSRKKGCEYLEIIESDRYCGGFAYKCKNGLVYDTLVRYIDKPEIVGNIYENPEMMENKNA